MQLTRLGYFFKDPKHYGEATLGVLRETAKRYDDALNDCLIQIVSKIMQLGGLRSSQQSQLEAKWLLEHQLAQNRARRAREAAETEHASNKRKLESVADEASASTAAQILEENPAKKIKLQHIPSDDPLPIMEIQEEPMKNCADSQPTRDDDKTLRKIAKPVMTEVEENGQKSGVPDKKEVALAEVGVTEKNNVSTEFPPDKSGTAPPDEFKKQQKQKEQSKQREQKEQKEQADLPTNDEDMNFESMFRDANAGTDQNNDLSFDLDLNTDNLGGSNPFDSTAHGANNLELLPGLESYANASGDEFGMLNLPSSSTAIQPGVRALENNFDLPEIQGDSNFNDLFADGDFGEDASLMDLDLEDGFF